MNLNEILKGQNISDEIIQTIMEAMKANKIFTASEENMDIRYGKLKTQHDATSQQLTEANSLIEELKKTNAGNDALQSKVTEYETQIAALQAQLAETQLDADLNTALLSAGAKPEDLDYLVFKIKAKGKMERGEDGKLKDVDDRIAAMKTLAPAHFTSEAKVNILENKLPTSDASDAQITKEQFKSMPYEKRLELKNNKPEVFKRLAY